VTGHLIHIGFPKTGSNYLRAWFRRHPQLEYADGGIAGFHTVYQMAKRGALPASGVRYHVTSAEHLSVPTPNAGDPVHTFERHHWTSIPQAQSAMCKLLGGLFGSARVLCVTRGFRSMVFSSYSQFVRAGGTTGFAEFCDSIRADPTGLVWDYNRMLALYRGAFSPAQVRFMPYELLRDDPAGFTRALEAWLELDRCEAAAGRMNSAIAPEALVWYPRITRAVLGAPIGGRLRRRLFRWHIGQTMAAGYRLPLRLAHRLFPTAPIEASSIPDSCLDAFRGTADALRHEPLYAPYADDYFNR
jgi:Sulfotransferase family